MMRAKIKEPELVAAIRVDGVKRTNLQQQRERRALANEARKKAPPVEDDRVSQAWERQDGRDAAYRKNAIENRAIKALAETDGGHDGTVVEAAEQKLTVHRSEKRSIRCRPGTFEWRYGRKTADAALYHAGCDYAILWERAGTASASSPDWMSEGGGSWKGLPDGRAVILQEVQDVVRSLGKLVSARLTEYCVHGRTTGEIARKFGVSERDMAPVLESDLRACAIHMRYL